MRRSSSEKEIKRAEQERARLAELEQPKLDPAKECPYCFGSGFEQRKDEHGYITSAPCDHKPTPF